MSPAPKSRPTIMAVVGRAFCKVLYRVALKIERYSPDAECSYCCELKPFDAFPRKKMIPRSCRPCLASTRGHRAQRICKTCLAKYLETQLESKHPLQISCPECTVFWHPFRVAFHYILDSSDTFTERYKIFNEKMGHPLQSSAAFALYEPPKDKETLITLLEQDWRICPYCASPFQRSSGCPNMTCGKCKRDFYLFSAPTVAAAHDAYTKRTMAVEDALESQRESVKRRERQEKKEREIDDEDWRLLLILASQISPRHWRSDQGAVEEPHAIRDTRRPLLHG